MIASRNIPLNFCFLTEKLDEIIDRQYFNGTGAIILLQDEQYSTLRNFFALKQQIDNNSLTEDTRERREKKTVPIGTHNNFFENVGSHLGIYIGFIMECTEGKIPYNDEWFFDEEKLESFFHVCRQIYSANTYGTKAKSISLLLKHFLTKSKFANNIIQINAILEYLKSIIKSNKNRIKMHRNSGNFETQLKKEGKWLTVCIFFKKNIFLIIYLRMMN